MTGDDLRRLRGVVGERDGRPPNLSTWALFVAQMSIMPGGEIINIYYFVGFDVALEFAITPHWSREFGSIFFYESSERLRARWTASILH